VAERVVDRLEAVEVQVAEPDPLPGRAAERGLQPFGEQRAVGEPGQVVVVGLVPQLLGQHVPLGVVLDHADEVLRGAALVPHQRHGDVRPQW
jgi:hypothetical protein